MVGLVMGLSAWAIMEGLKPKASLYDRLGGRSAIEPVVSDFVDTVGAWPCQDR